VRLHFAATLSPLAPAPYFNRRAEHSSIHHRATARASLFNSSLTCARSAKSQVLFSRSWMLGNKSWSSFFVMAQVLQRARISPYALARQPPASRELIADGAQARASRRHPPSVGDGTRQDDGAAGAPDPIRARRRRKGLRHLGVHAPARQLRPSNSP